MSRTSRFHPTIRIVGITLLSIAGMLAGPHQPIQAQVPASGASLRFYGHGVDDLDRVKISVDDPSTTTPGPAVDVGAADFTIEFWLRALDADNNTVQGVSCGANVDWINGNIIVDRDRFSLGRKFGVSVDQVGRIVFGVTNDAMQSRTLCGTTSVLDGQWHHVAVQRRISDGRMWVFVDGALQAQASGPVGDISYPDSASLSYRGPQYCRGPNNAWGGYCQNEPFIVLGAEKHDAGQDEGNASNYPSFSGWLDELRLSNSLRYSAAFTRPSAPFVTDANTVGLYHFDDGATGACTGAVQDASQAAGGPSHGQCFYGGAGSPGPVFAPETPWQSSSPPSTPVPTPTSAVITPTATVVPPPTTTPGPPVPTTAPPSGSSDDFNRSDTTDLGAKWMERTGDFMITSQVLRNGANAENIVATWAGGIYEGVETSVRTQVAGGNGTTSLCVRLGGYAGGVPTRGYCAELQNNGQMILWRIDTFQSLGSYQIANYTAGQWVPIGLRAVGSSLTVLVGGVARITATDVVFTSGDAGVWSYQPGNVGQHGFDDFVVQALQ